MKSTSFGAQNEEHLIRGAQNEQHLRVREVEGLVWNVQLLGDLLHCKLRSGSAFRNRYKLRALSAFRNRYKLHSGPASRDRY